jgi:hypothetical protein
MKMKTADFEALRAMVELHAPSKFARAKADEYRERGLTPKRYRWDMFWSIPQDRRQDWFADFQIYNYLNDDHIDTALRVLIPHKW